VNHYQTLQVARDAEPEVIEKAYKALSLKYHPDRVSPEAGLEATRRMQAINEAYRVLKAQDTRTRYDRSLRGSRSDHSAWDVFMDKGLLGMFLEKVSTRP